MNYYIDIKHDIPWLTDEEGHVGYMSLNELDKLEESIRYAKRELHCRANLTGIDKWLSDAEELEVEDFPTAPTVYEKHEQETP